MNEINNQLETELNELGDQIGEMPKPRFDWKAIPNKVGESARTAAQYTDGCVHNHTWSALGVALALGFTVGAILSRRA